MKYRGLISSAIVAALVLLLEVACHVGWIKASVVLPPSQMAVSLWELLYSGQFTGAIALTFGEIGISAVLSIIGGFIVGVIIHASPFLRRGFEPYLASYYAVPTFIFYPVFVVLFGVGSTAIIAIAVLLSIVGMITATLNGLDRIPKVLIRSARVLHLSPIATVLLVILPATLPYLFTGARLAIAYSFIGVIASEFILSGDGLGYAIAYAYNNFENRTMYGLMLLIIIAVSAINSVLNWLDQRLQRQVKR